MHPAPDTPAWHALRRRGIGGSDVADLLGLGLWANPRKLWELKTGRRQPGQATPAMERGKRLEPVVCDRFTRETGLALLPGEAFVKHPRFEGGVVMLANVDRRLATDGGVFEAKTGGQGGYAHQLFAAGRIPIAYALQCHLYAACLRVSGGVIACLVGDDGAHDWHGGNSWLYALEWRAIGELVALLEEIVAEWWKEYVVADRPPTYGRHDAASEVERLLRETRWVIGAVPAPNMI